MELELQYRWISADDFQKSNPVSAKIVSLEVTNINNRRDNILKFQVETTNELMQMSLWGDNFNKLVEKLGKESDAWKGKDISIKQEEAINGKSKKTIQVL